MFYNNHRMKDKSEINKDIESLQAAIAAVNSDDGVGRYDTVEQQIYEAAKRIAEAAKTSKAMHAKVTDAYSNQFLNISDMNSQNDVSSDVFQRYSLTNDSLNWGLWLAMYNGSWVFRKAIDKPAEDMVSCGISIKSDQDTTMLREDLFSLRSDLISLVKWGKLFGGAVGLIMFDSLKDKDYAQPIDFSKIKKDSVVRLYVTDRWYGLSPDYSDTVTNMSSLDYGKPKWYDISFADGRTIRCHHSYVLRFEGRDAPRLIKNGMLQGWGYAEGCHILNELMFHDKLKTSVQSLVDKALIEVIKMPGMRGIFMGADDSNSEQLSKRLSSVTWARNNNSLTFLDKDDDYIMNGFSGISGLADLLSQYRWDIASALNMSGILYGDQKSGLVGDTKALLRYNETIKSMCESELRPVMSKLLTILAKKSGLTETVGFSFNAIYKAEQDQLTLESITNMNALLDKLTSKGLMTQSDYARSLKAYIEDGSISISFSDALLHVVDKQSEDKGGSGSGGMSGSIDFDESYTSPESGSSEAEAPAENAEGGEL